MEVYYFTGHLDQIGEPKLITERFTKQEFIVRQKGQNGMKDNVIRFQVVNTRIPQLLKVKIGDLIDVAFNIKGAEWANPTTGESGINQSLQAFEINKSNHG